MLTGRVLATTAQYEALDALVRCGRRKEAAHDLGIGLAALDERMRKLRTRARMTTLQLASAHGAKAIVVQDGFWLESAAA
jgi:hypothetical protein